jgi:cellulose synthase/poly-beta-1,6-N-acetylglucosamine synthase-like glycosyltransferase
VRRRHPPCERHCPRAVSEEIGVFLFRRWSSVKIPDQAASTDAPEGGPEPVFTVIVPTYDRPRALRRCLEALAAQRYPRESFEVIVVNDGRDDAAATVVAEFCDRLRLSLLSQERAGPAVARNHGAASARGVSIAFIDDDCLATPDWLAAFASAFRANPRGALLGGAIANPLTDNVYAEVAELVLKVLLERYHPERGGVFFFRTANLAVRRDEFRASGGFDPSFATAEDREFCDRWIHRGGEMVRVPAAAVLHDNPLDFWTFLRRHYRYGRGAYRFHRLRRDRGSGRFRREFLWFYVFVLQACLASRRFVVRKVALVVLWQLCNLLGFFTELVSERGRRG